MNRQVWKILALCFLSVGVLVSVIGLAQLLSESNSARELEHLTRIPVLDESKFQNTPVYAGKKVRLGVGRTFLINMKERTDRYEHMKRQFQYFEIPFQHFPAIAFNYDNKTTLKAIRKTQFHPKTKFDLRLLKTSSNYTIGEIGCWQSHLQILLRYADEEDGYQMGQEPILILEDDLKMAPDFKYYISDEFLNTILPPDWEMLFLNHNGLVCHNPYLTAFRPHRRIDDYFLLHYYYPFMSYLEQFLPFTLSPSLKYVKYQEEPDSVCLIKSMTFADAYIIRNPEVASKLVEKSNTKWFTRADTYWNADLFPRKQIKAYALLHPVARQQRLMFGSDIARWGAWNRPDVNLRGTSA